MWFGKPNKHKSISGESFIPKPGGLSARGGLPAFCLGRDSGRILARALVLFGADAVELFKRPAEVGAVLVPHRHGNVPDFLPAAQQQSNPCRSSFPGKKDTACRSRSAGASSLLQAPQREPALWPSRVLPTAPRASGVGKGPQGMRRLHHRGNFSYKTYPHSGKFYVDNPLHLCYKRW